MYSNIAQEKWQLPCQNESVQNTRKPGTIALHVNATQMLGPIKKTTHQ